MGIKLEDPYATELQTVLRIAQALKEITSISCPPSHSPFTTSGVTVAIDAIHLPGPQPLLPSLLEAGVRSEIASAASQIYHRRAEELKQHIQQSIAATCRKAAESSAVLAHVLPPDLLMKKVVPIFTDIYFCRLQEWKEEIVQRIKQASELPTETPPRSSRTFNQEYVPLLEHFFEENPFPTHADKMFLAKKSNMEYRQIHVWFQNRRNRTKKEGKTLRKRPPYEGATKPLDKFYRRMRCHMVDSDSKAPKFPTVGSWEGASEINMSKAALASSSPPHAFPSSYPPTCHYDPFPCKNGPVRFSQPEWRRIPDGKHSSSLSTSIDDLVEKFSRLNVRDGIRSKGSKLASHSATVAITVIPSRAPHPSLIAHERPQHTKVFPLGTSVRAPVSCPKAFQSPSPTSKPVTLVPLSASPSKSKLPGKRKIASLPQRFPDRMRNTPRDTTPLDSSSASSSSPRSCSTDPESRSYSFATSSSLSTPSDAASVLELPHLFGSPCRSPSDSPIYLRGLRDIIAISPSPVP